MTAKKIQRDMTVDEAIGEWLLMCNDHYDDRTLRIYGQAAELIQSYIGNIFLNELNDEILSQYFDKLHHLTIGDTGVKNVYTVLNGACKYAVSQGFLPVNPLTAFRRKDLLQLGGRKERRRKEEFFLSHEQAAGAESCSSVWPTRRTPPCISASSWASP